MSRYSLVLLAVLCCSIGHEGVCADRLRCEKPDYISNGSYRLKRNFMRVTCDAGYQLQGLRTIGCVRGKWDGEKPVCAKKGCPRIVEAPDNGRIQIESELKAILYCSDNYSLAGNRHSYCNGTHWDRPIGTCRERSEKVLHECDFETDDICGWSYEPRANLEWKRVMAANVFTSFKTGPRHDHTTLSHNGGHYMLMESLIRQFMPVTLISPIYDRELSLKTACCFQFYYFMYGAGIGDLLVVVKPVSISLEDILISRNEFIKFERNGNQNSNWNEAHFMIQELEEDFQIIFVAKSGRPQLSDIAVDDVRLMTGKNCTDLDAQPENTQPPEDYDTTIDQSLYEVQSCVGRCYNVSSVGIILTEGHLKGLCSCDIGCEDANTCCPDFKTVCVNELFDATTVDSSSVAPNVDEDASTTKISSTSTSTTTTTTTMTTTTAFPTTKPTATTVRIVTSTSTIKTTHTTPRTTVATTTTPKPIPTTTRVKTTTLKTTTTQKPTTMTRSIIRTTKTTPSKTTTTKRPTTSTTRRATTTTSRTTTLKTITTTPQPIPTTPKKQTITPAVRTTLADLLSPSTDSNTNNPAQKSDPVSKKTYHVIDSDPKAETPLRGSSVLLCTLVLIVVIMMLAAVYRRYGNHAVAWYMIHFRKSSGGDESTSSITTSFRGSPRSAERNGGPSKRKLRKKALQPSDMKRPLVEDDDEDDDCNAINGSIALKKHTYTEL